MEKHIFNDILQHYDSSITIFARGLLSLLFSHSSILFLSMKRSPLRGRIGNGSISVAAEIDAVLFENGGSLVIFCHNFSDNTLIVNIHNTLKFKGAVGGYKPRRRLQS